MATTLLACLIFVFLLPCFSNSCPTTLPCGNSIQIKPPLYFQSDDYPNGPNCQGLLRIGCDENNPILFWYSKVFPLENISYETNIITVQDPLLSSSLNESGCGNVFFNFSTPVNNFSDKMYNSMNASLSSLRCHSPNQIQSPPDIFGKDYTIRYSPSPDEYHKPQPGCSPPDDSNPTFELMLLFHNESPNLSLQSASYSNGTAARPGCYANSKEVFCERCKEHTRRVIIIVSVLGSAFLIALLCLALLLYKRKKLKSASLSSNLLPQRQCSNQYFQDVEAAGSGYYTQSFCYKELEEATEGFSASKELGDGGFGVVYKGKLKDGRTVAVKRLYKNNYKRAEQFMNEVEILSQLHHPNLVTLHGRCNAPTTGELLLVYEFISNGTVADHLHGPRSGENVLAWPVRLSIAIETANALAYLHAVEPPIIHRDVKTNNILLDGDFHVKVADFGLSRLFPLDVTHVSTVPQGTPGYVDPVYHQCYHLTDKSDVYSFGVVLVELISSKPAVDLSRSKEEINLANMALIKIQNSQLDEIVDPALGFRSNWEVRCMISLVAELAFRCLQFDRETRPSIKEVLEALKDIEKGDYNREKLLKENMTKEETYLLKCDERLSPDNMTDSWTSSSVTPDTCG